MKVLQIFQLICLVGCVLFATTKANDYHTFDIDSSHDNDAVITDLVNRIKNKNKINLDNIIERQNEEISKMKAEILTEMDVQNAILMENIAKQNEKAEAIFKLMREIIRNQNNEPDQELLSQLEQMKLQKSDSDLILINYKAENEKLLTDIKQQQQQIAQLKGSEKTCNKSNAMPEEEQKGLIKTFEELHDEISQNKPIVIQRRIDGSVDFARTWHEYKMGFGNSSSEFFIGLETLYKLTNNRSYTLRIEMEDWEHERRYAEFNHFVIDNENDEYKLSSLGQYSGNAGDSLEYHLGQKFSTKNKDNDLWEGGSCSLKRGGGGGWWFGQCAHSNLNGPYKKDGSRANSRNEIIYWYHFKGDYLSLKFVEMTLRPN